MKKIVTILSFFFLSISLLVAQETNNKDDESMKMKLDEDGNLAFNIGLETNHLWRGLIITDKPVVTGQIWYTLNKSKTLQLGIWGASAISNDSDGTHYKEINYYFQYAHNGLTLGIWDLYNSRNINTLIASDDIFNYSKTRTAHILDLRTSYQFKPTFPLRLEADFLLFGGANAGEVILKPDGSYDTNKYSTYVQVSYPFIQQERFQFNAFVGAGFAFKPGKPSEGQTTYLYGNGKNKFDIVNIGFTATKKIKVFKTNIPLSLSTIWNPANGYARVQIATTLF